MRTPLNSIIIVTALVVLREYVHSAPIISTASQMRPVIRYLFKFGYFEKENSSDSRGSTHIEEAIQDLQRFGNLAVTGQLNRETLELLGKKRCGLKDPVKKLNTSNPIGRFYLQGTVWKKKHLTYRFKESTSDLSIEKQRNICRKMIDLWDKASSLKITEETDSSVKDDDVDILIRFVRGNHGDGYSFDGEGGTLAHAFYPHNNKGLSGDAHFDDDEDFTTGTPDGINLDWVAVHEFGHSLGLEHSNVRESIMYPWYKGYVPDIKLTRDDIKGIQALYGAEKPFTKSTTPSTPSTEPSTKPTPYACPTLIPACQTGSRYDAVIVEDPYIGKMKRLTHFIRGDKVWSLDDRLRKSGPVKVTCYWPHIITPINAAYQNKQKNVVFFSGSRVLEYSRTRELVRSINLEQYGLNSRLTNMDAVFTWKNGKTYFFKGSQYWRYNEEKGKLDAGYPRFIQAGWPDLPNNIDAAVTWPRNSKSYVFKDDYYLRLENHASGRMVRVEAIYRDHRKKTHKEWMRCHDNDVGAIIGSLIVKP